MTIFRKEWVCFFPAVNMSASQSNFLLTEHLLWKTKQNKTKHGQASYCLSCPLRLCSENKWLVWCRPTKKQLKKGWQRQCFSAMAYFLDYKFITWALFYLIFFPHQAHHFILCQNLTLFPSSTQNEVKLPPHSPEGLSYQKHKGMGEER